MRRTYLAVIAVMLGGLLIYWGAVIYVAVHFIRKFW